MTASVWEPDDGYTHGKLTKSELRWLAGKAQEAPSKSPADADTDQRERKPDKEKARG